MKIYKDYLLLWVMERTLVDTSLLVEPFTPWKNNEPNYKQACLALLQDRLHSFKERFKPVVSLSVLGEFNLVVREKLPKRKEFEDKIERMNALIKGFFDKCEIVGLSKEAIQICNELLSADNRLDPLDILHIATAISERCQNFMFIDYELNENLQVKKFAKSHELNLIHFGIKENSDIKKPTKSFIWHE